MNPTLHRRSRRLPVLLAIVVAVAGVGAWVLRSAVEEAHERAGIAAVEGDELRAARLRAFIADAAFSGLVDQLSDHAGIERTGDPAEPLDVLRGATGDLRTLVDDGRVSGAYAEITDDVLDSAERAIEQEGDLWALEEIAYVATTPAFPAAQGTAADSLLAASVLATSPSLIAVDALVLELAGTTAELSDANADYVSSTAAIVEDNPGWLGPDARSVFVDGYLPAEDLEVADPDLLRSLSETDGIETIWAYDQWLISRLDRPSPPPQELPDLVAGARSTQGRLTEQVVDAFDAAIAATAVDPPSGLATAAWLALTVVAAAGGLGLGVVIVRRARRLSDAVFVDPLTGVGNRRRLEQLEQQWADGDGPANAAVVVIDLDRFKLINDSWGHGAGDVVLRYVGQGLIDLAAGADHGGDVAEVVRLGGDEFALVVSSATPLVESVLHERVVGIGGSVPIGGGDRIDVSLSVGVVCAAHPADLADLLAAADLRTYEHKKRRRAPIAAEPQAGDVPV